MTEIKDLSKRITRIESALKRLKATHPESLSSITELTPSLFALKTNFETVKKQLAQIQNDTNKNIVASTQTKFAAKGLYEETMKLISDLRSSKEIDCKRISVEISEFGTLLELTDRKITTDVSKAEERVATEALEIAREYANVCEGNKDYVKACTDLKVKQFKNAWNKGPKSPIKEEGPIEDVDEAVESSFKKYSTSIIQKLEEEVNIKKQVLETVKTGKSKEQARALMWAIKELKDNKKIRLKIVQMENEFEENIEKIMDDVDDIDRSFNDIEIEYLEKLLNSNKKEMQEAIIKITKFNIETQERLKKVLLKITAINTINGISKEYTNLINSVKGKTADNKVIDEANIIAKREIEEITAKRKGDCNFIIAKVRSLKKRLEFQLKLLKETEAKL